MLLIYSDCFLVKAYYNDLINTVNIMEILSVSLLLGRPRGTSG